VARTDNNIARSTRSDTALGALEHLARLHDETSHSGRLAQFLSAAVHIAALFMLMGVLVLVLGGGTTIGRNFSWGLLLLVGVAALLRSYIRTHARAFDRAPLPDAARELRVVLLYMGTVWGAGAFLALPSGLSTLPLILFAAVPFLLLALLFTDVGGLTAFVAPATLLIIAAALMRSLPHAGLGAVILLVVQWGLFSGILIRGRRRAPLPAGFALR
jgi:hypothetical protein